MRFIRHADFKLSYCMRVTMERQDTAEEERLERFVPPGWEGDTGAGADERASLQGAGRATHETMRSKRTERMYIRYVIMMVTMLDRKQSALRTSISRDSGLYPNTTIFPQRTTTCQHGALHGRFQPGRCRGAKRNERTISCCKHAKIMPISAENATAARYLVPGASV